MKVTESELRDLQKRVSGQSKTGAAGERLAGAAMEPQPTTRTLQNGSPYRSNLESQYATYLHGLQLAGDILKWRYESVRLKLIDGSIYVPDFYIRWKDGHGEYHEIKGHRKALIARAGVLKLRVAQASWPEWIFVLVTHQGGRWAQERVMIG